MPGGGGKGGAPGPPGPPGPGGIIPGGGKPGPGGKGGRAAESSKRLSRESPKRMLRLTSTKSRGRNGSAESAGGRTHAHWGSTHGWWAKMLRTEAEASRRGSIAGFISSCNLVDNILGLVVS